MGGLSDIGGKRESFQKGGRKMFGSKKKGTRDRGAQPPMKDLYRNGLSKPVADKLRVVYWEGHDKGDWKNVTQMVDAMVGEFLSLHGQGDAATMDAMLAMVAKMSKESESALPELLGIDGKVDSIKEDTQRMLRILFFVANGVQRMLTGDDHEKARAGLLDYETKHAGVAIGTVDPSYYKEKAGGEGHAIP
jgi:hypothetical protein